MEFGDGGNLRSTWSDRLTIWARLILLSRFQTARPRVERGAGCEVHESIAQQGGARRRAKLALLQSLKSIASICAVDVARACDILTG